MAGTAGAGGVPSSFPGEGSSLRSRNDVVEVSSTTGAVVVSSCSVAGTGVGGAGRLNLVLTKDRHWPIPGETNDEGGGGRADGKEFNVAGVQTKDLGRCTDYASLISSCVGDACPHGSLLYMAEGIKYILTYVPRDVIIICGRSIGFFKQEISFVY